MVTCVYCKGVISTERTMQICDSCGCKVWGTKMFKAILQGTDHEKCKGNMELGRVGEGENAGSIQELHKRINEAKNLIKRG